MKIISPGDHPWSKEVEALKGVVVLHIEDGIVGVGDSLTEALQEATDKGYIHEELFVDSAFVPSIPSVFPVISDDE